MRLVRKCLPLLAVAGAFVAVPTSASASTAPEGIRWNHRPAPVYCEATGRFGMTINQPPYGACYGGVWVYDTRCSSWWFRVTNPSVC